MPIEDSVFQLDYKCFPIYFWDQFCKNTFAKASSTDLVCPLQVPDQNERVKGMETGWSDDQP